MEGKGNKRREGKRRPRKNEGGTGEKRKQKQCRECPDRRRAHIQGSKLTLAYSQNASAFDNLRVRKIATSKRLRVRIIHVYQTFGKNLLVISPVCQQEKILLAKLCKWTKKLTSSLDIIKYLIM